MKPTPTICPRPDAWSPGYPLHALAMYKMTRDGLKPAEHGVSGPMQQIADLQAGACRWPLSATWSAPAPPASPPPTPYCGSSATTFRACRIKKGGGICIGGKVAPIFYNTMEDAGALVFEAPVDKIGMGDVIEVRPYDGKILSESGEVLSEFELKSEVLLDEVRAGGRINLIIGRGLTTRARAGHGLLGQRPVPHTRGANRYRQGLHPGPENGGQGLRHRGHPPGTYCEPLMTTVGSQDTTGPMTRDELKDLACLGFSADLTMQSFCHTAAYPKPVDIDTQHTLPDFIMTRGGVSLRPGDGIIHSWLNRMLLPDTVGTGGDSHTRFPMGISFPAGSGLVAFAAATGVMPLDMPESVLVRFKGEMQPGITLRDLVHAIPTTPSSRAC